MDIDEFKSNWKQSGTDKKSRKELMMMVNIQNHPKLNRIRIRLIIEVILLVAFIVSYNNIFDGVNKPLWVNIALLITAALFIITDVIGYFILQNPIRGNNIKESIFNLHINIKRISVFSLIVSFLFGLVTIIFFTIAVSQYKYLKFAGLLITLFFMIYMSYNSWLQRMNQIKKSGMEFEEESEFQPQPFD